MTVEEYWSVDRLEGETAVCQDDGGALHLLPLDQLDFAVQESDVLRRTESGWALDPEEKKRRQQRAEALLRRLEGRR
ncbi:DUF3006 domain-containing protein [Neobittarella massiliensis]|uniref:DUF3006 domain-containing protein n=1 Tax=Neobittarella massiliensis (ex Bilen et al. 2018) TaxID=2041842 RepID=UPI000CF69251|nr:DUF3006 domain-containing protein [Neobittarella massiliensis]